MNFHIFNRLVGCSLDDIKWIQYKNWRDFYGEDMWGSYNIDK